MTHSNPTTLSVDEQIDKTKKGDIMKLLTFTVKAFLVVLAAILTIATAIVLSEVMMALVK